MGTDPDTPDMGDTSIRVSEELADELYSRKGRGTSYEDFIWQLLDRVDEPAREHASSGGEPPEPEPTPTGGVADPHREQLRDALAGSGDLVERRADAVLAMYEVLRERGSAEKDELLDAVDVDAAEYASRDSVWSNMIKGKATLSALPGVETPPTGRTEWRYVDE